jgi:AraC-like DNA-binding protein
MQNRWTSTGLPLRRRPRSTTSSAASKATYGETPIRYLAKRRIERAQDLLRATNLTVTEVCMVVGYTSLGTSGNWWVLVEPREYTEQDLAAEGWTPIDKG